MIVLNESSGGAGGGSRTIRSNDEIGAIQNFGNIGSEPIPDPIDDTVIRPTATPEPLNVSVTAESTKNVTRWALVGGAVILGLIAFRES